MCGLALVVGVAAARGEYAAAPDEWQHSILQICMKIEGSNALHKKQVEFDGPLGCLLGALLAAVAV